MLSLDRQELVNLLTKILIVSRETTLDSPLLGQIIDGDLVLWYDSFEASIWATIPDTVDGDLDLFSVSIDKLYRVLTTWSKDEVKLTSMEGNSLRVSCGRNRLTLPYYEGMLDEIIMPDEGELIGRLPYKIVHGFAEVIPFLSKVETYSGLLSCSNLYAGNGNMGIIGCDSFHIFIQESKYDGEDVNMVFPMKSTDILGKILRKDMDVDVFLLDNGFLLFETDEGFSLQIAPFNGEYPKIKGMIEVEYKDLFQFDHYDMAEAIKLADAISDSRTIRIYTENGEIRFNSMLAEEDTNLFLEAKMLTTGDFDILVSTSFLKHCLDLYTGEEKIRFLVREDNNMVKLLGSDEKRVTTLMVMQR